MKKIKKINLQIDKEVISSLSNDEMNTVKGGVATYGMGGCSDDPWNTMVSCQCQTKAPNCPDTQDPKPPYLGIETQQIGECYTWDCGTTGGESLNADCIPMVPETLGCPR